MTVNQLAAAADSAAERYDIARQRGGLALVSLAAARKALADAEQAQTACQAVLDRLADASLADEPADGSAVSSAILEIEDAGRSIVWANARIAAAQRSIQAAQAALAEAETDRMATAEASRKASVRARAEQLAYQTA